MTLTDNNASVNRTLEKTAKDVGAERFNDRYHRWRASVYENLEAQNMNDEARMWLECGTHRSQKLRKGQEPKSGAATVHICPHNPHHDAVQFLRSCDLRICPDCAARQTARLAARYVPLAKELCKTVSWNKRLRHIVLTTPFSLGLLPLPQLIEIYKRMWQAVASLWSSLEAENGRLQTYGTIEAAEFGEHGHKLHFHIIHYGSFLPNDDISRHWKKLTGGECEVTHARGMAADDLEQLENDVMETIKYSVKFWKRDREGNVSFVPPELMPKLLMLLKGTRRVRTRGVFYGIPEVEREPLCCESCGSEMLRIGVEIYNYFIHVGKFPENWRHGERLNLILANKSDEPPPDKPPDKPPKQVKMSFMDELKPDGINHYE